MDARAQRYRVPPDAREAREEGVEAVAYLYEHKGLAAATCFSGRRSKPDVHVAFHRAEDRDERVKEWFERQRRLQQRKRARDEYRHGLQVGDVIVNEWGYDQTNVDFYQVVGRTAKTVTLKRIAAQSIPGSAGFMCDRVVPVPGKFLDSGMYGPAIRKRVMPGDRLRFDHGAAHKWDGKPCYRSWYA